MEKSKKKRIREVNEEEREKKRRKIEKEEEGKEESESDSDNDQEWRTTIECRKCNKKSFLMSKDPPLCINCYGEKCEECEKILAGGGPFFIHPDDCPCGQKHGNTICLPCSINFHGCGLCEKDCSINLKKGFFCGECFENIMFLVKNNKEQLKKLIREEIELDEEEIKKYI